MYCTLILAYDVFEVNDKRKGKKSDGVEEGAENSMEPDFVDKSTIGNDHTSIFFLASWVY